MFENIKMRNLIFDKEKIDVLIRKNYMDIYKYCYYHVGNRETAQDITQDVFLKFLKGLDHYAEYGKLKNYLYVIAKNSVRDYFRRPKAKEPESIEVQDDGGLSEIPERLDIIKALDTMNPFDKEIIILRYYQDLRIRDIAQILKMPVSTVRYKLKKAEKVLKLKLGDVEV